MPADLASDLACALDPVLLARRAGMEPDAWQAELLRTDPPRALLNCSRQSGKSTTAAVLAVHGALYTPGSLTLLLSPALRQSSELFKKCLAIYRGAGCSTRASSETALTLTLDNGARIVSLPGQEGTIRGFSGVHRLIIDEAARVPDSLYFAVRPMVAVSGGSLIAMSTPFGTRGFFYDAWRSDETWQRVEVPATLVPRISPEFLAEEERSMGRWWFEQEYLCRFLDAQDAVFRLADIEAAFSVDAPPPLFGGIAS